MSDIKLGELCNDTVQRDAVHVAVAPVIAGELLQPGQHIGLLDDGTAGDVAECDQLGIVDPYLEGSVSKGQRFLLCLYPNAATGMRHHWSHPKFPDLCIDATKINGKSVQWLKDFATKAGLTYDKLVSIIKAYARDNDNQYKGPGYKEAWGVYDRVSSDEFWSHVNAALSISPVITDVCCAGEVYYGSPFKEGYLDDDEDDE